MKTFDELFKEHYLSEIDRIELVWYLAMYRARKTVEILLRQNIDGLLSNLG